MTIKFIGDTFTATERVQTGLHSLDYSLGDALNNTGWPLRSFVEVYGPKNCIAGDMFIQYEIRTKDGRKQNGKGGTIKHLYERFNKIPVGGLGYYQRKQTIDSLFYVSSVDEDGHIIKNLVTNVVYSGVQKTYKVLLDSGDFIICTSDHELLATTYSGDAPNPVYIPLRELEVGDTLFIHNNTHLKNEHKKLKKYKEVMVKYHPYAKSRIVNGCRYHRLRYSHLVYEAYLNDMSIESYRWFLNNGSEKVLKQLTFIDQSKYDVHHIDEDHENNVIGNMMLMSHSEHLRHHALKSNAKFSRRTIVPSKIVDIKEDNTQDVYDIQCLAPHHNFVANKIVVHNCGKTSFCLSVIGMLAGQLRRDFVMLDWEGQSRETVSGILEHVGFDGTVDYVLNVIKPSGKFETSEETAARWVEKLYANPQPVSLMDSLGAFRPTANMEGGLADANIGAFAREAGRLADWIIAALQRAEHPSSVMMTNHVHPTIGSYVAGQDTAGGVKKKYLAQLRIDLKRTFLKTKKDPNDKDSGSVVDFGHSWLLGGRIDSSRFGYSKREFNVFMIAGEGIHTGMTAVFDCVVSGLADVSSKKVTESATVSISSKTYKVRELLNEREDPDLFNPFVNALRADAPIDTESTAPKKKRGKRK